VGNEARQPLEAVIPKSVGHSVQRERMQPRITGQNLPRIARGRIALDNDADVFAKPGQQRKRAAPSAPAEINNVLV
jgi:hypothetical protein